MDDQGIARRNEGESTSCRPPISVSTEGNPQAIQPATAQQLADGEEKMSAFERSTLKWARTAVVLSGAAALFVCLQWKEMDKQWSVMHDQFKTSYIQTRPYVFVEKATAVYKHNHGYDVLVTLKNYGPTPAYGVTTWMDSVVSPELANRDGTIQRFSFENTDTRDHPTSDLAPGATWVLPQEKPRVIDLDGTAGAFIYSWGLVKYRDNFDGQSSCHDYAFRLSGKVAGGALSMLDVETADDDGSGLPCDEGLGTKAKTPDHKTRHRPAWAY